MHAHGRRQQGAERGRAPWIFIGTDIVDRGLTVLFFGLFCYFSVFFAIFWSFLLFFGLFAIFCFFLLFFGLFSVGLPPGNVSAEAFVHADDN